MSSPEQQPKPKQDDKLSKVIQAVASMVPDGTPTSEKQADGNPQSDTPEQQPPRSRSQRPNRRVNSVIEHIRRHPKEYAVTVIGTIALACNGTFFLRACSSSLGSQQADNPYAECSFVNSEFEKKYVVACYETDLLTELSDEIRHNIRTFIDAINENEQVKKDGGFIILKPGESVNLLVLAGIDTIAGFNQKDFKAVFSEEKKGYGIFGVITAANIAASEVPDLVFRAGPASEAHRDYAPIFASEKNGYTADEVESLIAVIYVGDPNQQAIFTNNSTDQTYAVRFEYTTTTTQDDGKDLPRTVRVVISQSDNDSSGKGQ